MADRSRCQVANTESNCHGWDRALDKGLDDTEIGLCVTHKCVIVP
jgi:hypothetical protein